MVDVLPTRLYQCWASAKVVATTVAPPMDDTLPKWKTPTIVTGSLADERRQLHVLAHVQVVVVGKLLDQGHLAVPLGIVAGDERVLVEGLGQRRDDQVGGAALRLHVLAVHDQRSRRLDLALGLGDAGDPRTWAISDAGSGPT